MKILRSRFWPFAQLRLPRAYAPETYLAANPDLAASRRPLWLHWLTRGRYEERWPAPLAATLAERALWSGDEAGRAELSALLQSGAEAERIWASLALARAAMVEGDVSRAEAALAALSWQGDLVEGLGMPTPLLFAFEIALRNGRLKGLPEGFALYRRAFGEDSALAIFEAAYLAKAQGEAAWGARMAGFYQRLGLAVPRLLPPQEEGPVFDRLDAKAPAFEDGPLVTVLLAVRNGAATLPTALRGVMAQSHRNLEVLILDNGSDDATRQGIAPLLAQDPRLRLIEAGTESGAYGARNLGLSQAKGAFVTLQDADDWAHPERLRLQLRALQGGAAVACLSHWLRVTEDLSPSLPRPAMPLLHANLSSLLMRREAFERAGFWDEVRAAADTEYIARLRRIFGAEAVPQIHPQVPLAFGRMAEGSLTLSPATGLFGAGALARAAYKAASEAWHENPPEALYLPRRPATRPFAAPEALLPRPRG